MSQPIQPFDLAKLDYEGRRKALRKKLIVFSLPVLVVFLVVATKFLSLAIFSDQGLRAYESGAYSKSSQSYSLLRFVNVIEPYKAWFNQGTAQLQAKQYAFAETLLQNALDRSDDAHECQIRVNLVLSIVGQADAAAADKKYQDAILHYDRAKSVIDARDCGLKISASSGKTKAGDQEKEADEKLKQQDKNIQKKQSDAKEAQNGDKPSDSLNDSNQADNNESSEPDDSQLQKIKDKQQDTAKKAQKSRQSGTRKSQQDSSSRDYRDKTW